MAKQIKDVLTQADDIQRLKYLLAKDDVDDLQAAAQIVSNNLNLGIPGLTLRTSVNRIEVESRSEKYLTIVSICLNEEHLVIKYNLYSEPDLFKQKKEYDINIVGNIVNIITRLGFFKTGERQISEHKICWQIETYKIEVIRRKF